jgi:hypothetical protein
VYYVDVPP